MPPILDYDNELSSAQGPIIAQVFSTPGRALGGPPAPIRDWGTSGGPLKLYSRVVQAFNNLTSLDVEIGGADDSAGTNFVSYLKQNFLAAALTVGALLPLGAVPPGKTKKLYLLGRYTPNGAAPTTGKLTVGAVDWNAGPADGFNAF